jgi:pseudouridine synthase
VRLQRYLAAAGVASRRRAEELIVAGRVRVNGRVARELGTTVDPGDVVHYEGRVVAPAQTATTLVLHKPVGVVTTLRDPEGRRTVADVLRAHAVDRRVVPVGRLDYDTSGVLLLTDDGGLAHVLAHPRYGVDKTYRAAVAGRLEPRDVSALRSGVRLAGERAQPAQLRVVAARRDRSLVDLTIHEGRNRQVRRMFEQLGHPVLELARLRFGPVALGDLAVGALRPITEREAAALQALVRAAQEQEAEA